MLKGSGRTFGNVDLKALLDTASDLFVGYGGHPGAAGMSIMKEKLPALQKRLSEALEGVDFGVDPDVLYYDMEISVSQVPDIIRQLHLYAPFGQGNPSPVFKITGFECTPKGSAFFRLMGNKEQHIKFFGKEVDALGFDMKARYDEDGQPKKMEFIGVLTQNYFNGQFYNQIEIIDYRPCKNEETELKKSLADLLVFC